MDDPAWLITAARCVARQLGISVGAKDKLPCFAAAAALVAFVMNQQRTGAIQTTLALQSTAVPEQLVHLVTAFTMHSPPVVQMYWTAQLAALAASNPSLSETLWATPEPSTLGKVLELYCNAQRRAVGAALGGRARVSGRARRTHGSTVARALEALQHLGGVAHIPLPSVTLPTANAHGCDVVDLQVKAALAYLPRFLHGAGSQPYPVLWQALVQYVQAMTGVPQNSMLAVTARQLPEPKAELHKGVVPAAVVTAFEFVAGAAGVLRPSAEKLLAAAVTKEPQVAAAAARAAVTVQERWLGSGSSEVLKALLGALRALCKVSAHYEIPTIVDKELQGCRRHVRGTR